MAWRLRRKKSGKLYKVTVHRDQSYLGSAVVRRIGHNHSEASVSVIDQKYLDEVIDALRNVIGSFRFQKEKPELGRLIQEGKDGSGFFFDSNMTASIDQIETKILRLNSIIDNKPGISI